MKKAFVLFIILAIWTPLGHAQQAAGTQSVSVQQSAEDRGTRVYEIKWRSADDIHALLEGFVSYPIRSNSSLNTLTVTATERVHVLIAELIRKYDVPVKTIEFQFFLIRAATVGEGLKDGLPDKIRKVINEVSALTRYKSFEVMDAPIIRVSEGKEAQISGRGADRLGFYNIRLGRGGALIATTDQGKKQIRVNEFVETYSVTASVDEKGQFRYRDIGVNTSFTIGDGEQVVLGASQMIEEKGQGTGLITAVTAKVLN